MSALRRSRRSAASAEDSIAANRRSSDSRAQTQQEEEEEEEAEADGEEEDVEEEEEGEEEGEEDEEEEQPQTVVQQVVRTTTTTTTTVEEDAASAPPSLATPPQPSPEVSASTGSFPSLSLPQLSPLVTKGRVQFWFPLVLSLLLASALLALRSQHWHVDQRIVHGTDIRPEATHLHRAHPHVTHTPHTTNEGAAPSPLSSL